MTGSRRLLVLAAIVAPLVAPVTAAACPGGGQHGSHPVTVVRAHGPLTDLQPGTVGPFDTARASFRLVGSGSRSHAVLRVRGVGASARGLTYGAHLHVGPCLAGDGAAAGPHYNTDVLAGVVPPRVGPTTELWLDITVRAGRAAATTSVPFVPVPRTRSVVIHEMATDPATGTAGARLACLPLDW